MEQVVALGRELVRVHDWLREDLKRLRDDQERDDPPPAVRCLAFCDALTRHHTAEDGVAFVRLAERFPDLAPVIAALEDDHRLIAGIARQIEEVAADPGARRGELAGLAAILESHFTFEERRIARALDELDGHGAGELFGVLPPPDR